ncbi:MarR family winged helix-turn-helix transcriptional regulator [Melioribacteraceae bacterium 4301-Me]|uniref:MarR family winged helix-turn-helix transcriptional regulator n=1 Tax=Pyranulibacter aquaticus TaxID=3163344 RepID=UPI00359B805C
METRHQLTVDLLDKLSKAYDKFRKVQIKQMYKEKLTAPQFQVLEVLSKTGPVPLKKISEELMVTGANITCVMDNLEKEGLVERIHSKEDRRVILADLTEKGKAKINSIMPTYLENISAITNALSEQEHKELINLLAKLS